jgi:hypothetical protein
VVIDTFPGLAGLGDEQQNDAGAITGRLQPLQVAAGAGLAVLFLHHMNNANQPRGSKAFRGVVDTSIRFLRKAKNRSFRLESETRSTMSLSQRRIDRTARIDRQEGAEAPKVTGPPPAHPP